MSLGLLFISILYSFIVNVEAVVHEHCRKLLSLSLDYVREVTRLLPTIPKENDAQRTSTENSKRGISVGPPTLPACEARIRKVETSIWICYECITSNFVLWLSSLVDNIKVVFWCSKDILFLVKKTQSDICLNGECGVHYDLKTRETWLFSEEKCDRIWFGFHVKHAAPNLNQLVMWLSHGLQQDYIYEIWNIFFHVPWTQERSKSYFSQNFRFFLLLSYSTIICVYNT